METNVEMVKANASQPVRSTKNSKIDSQPRIPKY